MAYIIASLNSSSILRCRLIIASLVNVESKQDRRFPSSSLNTTVDIRVMWTYCFLKNFIKKRNASSKRSIERITKYSSAVLFFIMKLQASVLFSFRVIIQAFDKSSTWIGEYQTACSSKLQNECFVFIDCIEILILTSPFFDRLTIYNCVQYASRSAVQSKTYN